MMKFTLALITSFILILTLAFDFNHKADAHVWPRYDGVIRMPFESETLTLDPTHDMTYDELSMFFALYDGLFYINGKNEVKENLASSFTADSSYRQYLISLNTFARFHDGSVLTSDDVVSSVKRSISKIGSKAQALDNIINIRAIDQKTLEIQLKRADPDFPRILAHPFCHITKGSIQRKSNEAIRINYYQGTGPFIIESISRNNLRFERYQNYHRGRAYIQFINFKLQKIEQDSFLQFASGRLDIHRIPYSEYSELKDGQGINRFISPGNDTIFLTFGNRDYRFGLINALRLESILNVVMNHSGAGYKGILPADDSGFFDRSNLRDNQLPTNQIVLGYFGDTFLLEPVARRIAFEWESKGVDVTLVKLDDFPCSMCDVVVQLNKTMNQNSEFVWKSIRYDLGMIEPLPDEIALFRMPEIEEQKELLDSARIYPIARPHMAFALSQHVRDFHLIAGCVPDFWRINLK